MEEKSSFRVYERYKPDPDVKCRAKFVHADEVKIKNISMGGMLAETSRRLNVNNTYKIQITYPDNKESITPTCVIVRSFLRSSIHKTPLYEVALKFTELNDKEKHFLMRLIKEFSKRNK
jgi:hypothetical protein